MAKIELGKVIDLIIKEDNAGVDALLENWFRQQTKQIHESIMEDDSIATDQDEIDSEEHFGSNDLSEDEESEEDLDLENDGSDLDIDTEISDEDDTGVASDLDDPDTSGVPDDVTTFSTDPDVIQDQFADVNADLERLEAEFDEIFGTSDSDLDTDSEDAGDINSDDLSEDVTDAELDADEDDMMNDLDDEEDEDPYGDLAEALKLDLVSIPDLEDEDGDEVGSGNDGIKGQNTKSPALQRGVDERFEGAGPVEIKSPNNAKGYPEFPKPDVKEGNGAKGTIRNKAEPLTNVPEGGDKSATLNKSFPKGNDKSILGDGADSREATIKKIARK